jgi:hypothetical protein
MIRKIYLPVRILLIAGIVFLVYGYLSRLGIYFFWESVSIGWDLLLVALLIFFLNRIRVKKRSGRKYAGEGIGLGITIFALLIRSVFYIVLPNSDAYHAATEFVKNNDSLRLETGMVRGIGLVPAGEITVQGESGEATIGLIVKGERKYEDLYLFLEKQPGSGWRVVAIRK